MRTTNLKAVTSETTEPVVTDSDANTEDRDGQTTALFERLSQCSSVAERTHLRDQIVELNMGVAKSLAKRYFGRGEQASDLIQVAYLGLTKAVNRFEPDQGNNFLSFAVPTITGEIRRHFRDHCWTVKPPRRIQDLQRNVSRIRQELTQSAQEEPTSAEIAEKLDVPESSVTEALSARGCFRPNSLDAPLSPGSTTTWASIPASEDTDFAQIENRIVLSSVMRTLSESDRLLLRLRFFDECTQDQIAKRFGTSQMQISRRLSRLMERLRNQVQPQPLSA